MKSLISSKHVSRTALSSCETKTKRTYIKTPDTQESLFFSNQSTHTITHNFNTHLHTFFNRQFLVEPKKEVEK